MINPASRAPRLPGAAHASPLPAPRCAHCRAPAVAHTATTARITSITATTHVAPSPVVVPTPAVPQCPAREEGPGPGRRRTGEHATLFGRGQARPAAGGLENYPMGLRRARRPLVPRVAGQPVCRGADSPLALGAGGH